MRKGGPNAKAHIGRSLLIDPAILATEEQLVQAVGELHGFERIANLVRWARASRARYLAGATLWQRSDYFRSLTAGRWPLVNSTPAFSSAFLMAAGISGSPP
jgi:hypothetical protein